MAQGEKKGLVARLIEGKERDEEYARSTLPTSRWSLFWDIFKGRFSKLVIVNLLMLLFFIPLIGVGVFRHVWLRVMGMNYPFSNGFLVGFPAYPNMVGAPEQIIFSSNITFGLFFILAAVVAAIGVSGGIYVIRNMIWTEGIFVANDFWHGIKINLAVILQSTAFYIVSAGLLMLSASWAKLIMATGSGNTGILMTSLVVSYIAMGFFTIMYLWMISMGGTYKLKFFQLLKNAFLMSFGFLFQNIFFIIMMAIPLILLLFGSFFMMLGIMLMVLFGISYMLLVWLDYSQWVFDKVFESRREGGQVNRGIYAKGGQQSKAIQEYEANLEAAMNVKSDLSSRPIKPITDDLKVYELPSVFSRDDLQKLRESKEVIVEDSEKYAEEHRNDEKYVEYNAKFEQAEKEAEETDKKDKKGKKSKEKSEKKDKKDK